MNDDYQSSPGDHHASQPATETREPAPQRIALIFAYQFTDPDSAHMHGLDPNGTYLRYQIKEPDSQPILYIPNRTDLLELKANGGRVILPGAEEELPFQLWKGRMIPVTRDLLDQYDIADLLG